VAANAVAQRQVQNVRLRSCDGIGEQIRTLSGPGEWTPVGQVHHNCHTDNTTVTCTFTNLSERAIHTCTAGRIYQKEAHGVKLESVVMCTGRLDPAATRVITAPWVGGFANSICYRETTFGRTLDWDKCEFTTDPVDLAKLRRMNKAAGP